jgi:hypothetical protein
MLKCITNINPKKYIVALGACLVIFKAFLNDLYENQAKINYFQRASSLKFTFTISELIQSKIFQNFRKYLAHQKACDLVANGVY